MRDRKRFHFLPVVLSAALLGFPSTSPHRDSRSPGRAPGAQAASSQEVKIGNYFIEAPYGIAVIVGDETAFLIDPDWDEKGAPSRYFPRDVAYVVPGTAAPDFSFFQATFRHQGAEIRFTWGRSGPAGVVALMETNRAVGLRLRLPSTWPRFHSVYTAAPDGIRGWGIAPRGRYVPFALSCRPAPVHVLANYSAEAEVLLALEPRQPTRLVAGVGDLPAIESVVPALEAAHGRYAATRIAASGDWGDFLGAMADNLNFSRLYGSDNARIAHANGRGWWLQRLAASPDLFPYFVWDFFFNALMANLEDPEGAKDTVRAVLSFQTPEDRGRARVRLAVHRLRQGRPGSDWLTRITPMNFYPLICGAPDAERARRVLAWMYREDKFWGRWLIPSVAYDDPVWTQQTYWRGMIWPPANYLLWQGLQRYADSTHRGEFVRRSIDLFMRNWTGERLCCENYRSTDGRCGDDPHYTWGALLCLIGLEALADVGPDFSPRPREDSGISADIVLRRVPFGGRLYRIEAAGGRIRAAPETR